MRPLVRGGHIGEAAKMITWNLTCPLCKAKVGMFSFTPNKVRLGDGNVKCKKCSSIFADGSLEWDDMTPEQKVEIFFPFRNYILWAVLIGVPVGIHYGASMSFAEGASAMIAILGIYWLGPQLIFRGVQIWKSKRRTRGNDRGIGVSFDREALRYIFLNSIVFGSLGALVALYAGCVGIVEAPMTRYLASAGWERIPYILFAIGGFVIFLPVAAIFLVPAFLIFRRDKLKGLRLRNEA